MFSDRYHLTASALARNCPSMTRLKLWITSSNCCRMSLLLLELNYLLKVGAVYIKVDSTISGAFQCSTSSAGAPPTCTSSTTNFLGVEGPFSDEVGPSRVVWRNCCLGRCVGAFSQLLKSFSKFLAWLMVLLQWGHFSILMGDSQQCCFSAASLEKNYVPLLYFWFFRSNILWVA